MSWATSQKIKIEENRGTYLKLRLPKSGTEWAASFVMETAKIIEVNLAQDPRGVVVQLEGYVKPPLSGEDEFSATAMMAGVPKRAGWRALEDLTARLNRLSGGPVPSMPFLTPPAQPAPNQYYVPPQPWPAAVPAPASPAPAAYPARNPPAVPYGASPMPTAYLPAMAPAQPMPTPQPFTTPARFCSSCGRPVEGADRFCMGCGSPII